MDVAGEVAQEGQADVDEEVGTAAGNDVNTYWRDCKVRERERD